MPDSVGTEKICYTQAAFYNKEEKKMLAINIEDVKNVLNSCKSYLIALGIIIVILAVVMIAVRKMEKPGKKLIRSGSWLAMLLAFVVIVNMICFGPMNSMISLAMGAGSINEESVADATALCEDIAEEGIVLLENEDNVLPYAGGTKLNVFGWASTNPVYGGTGSGGLSQAYPTVSLLEGLKNAGFEVNEELVKFYQDYCPTRPVVGMWGQDWTIPEPTIEDYDNAGIFESAKEFSDTALVVISDAAVRALTFLRALTRLSKIPSTAKAARSALPVSV